MTAKEKQIQLIIILTDFAKAFMESPAHEDDTLIYTTALRIEALEFEYYGNQT